MWIRNDDLHTCIIDIHTHVCMHIHIADVNNHIYTYSR